MKGTRLGWVGSAIVVAAALPILVVAGSLWSTGHLVRPVGSDSMLPVFERGDAVVIAPLDPADIEVGTIAAFTDPRNPTRTITHRVVAIEGDDADRRFRTRGDSNAADDPELVPARLLRGRVAWSVPRLGSAIEWAGRPGSALALAGTPLALLVVTEAIAAARQRRRTVRIQRDELDRLRNAAATQGTAIPSSAYRIRLRTSSIAGPSAEPSDPVLVEPSAAERTYSGVT